MLFFLFFFLRSCFIQTENNISYDNKTNEQKKKQLHVYEAIAQVLESVVFPCVLNVKAWETQ